MLTSCAADIASRFHKSTVDSARHSVSSLHRLLESEKLGLSRESLDLGGASADNSLLMAIENPLPPDSELSDDDAAIATMRLPPVRRGGSQVSVPLHPQSPPRSQSSVHTLFPGVACHDYIPTGLPSPGSKTNLSLSFPQFPSPETSINKYGLSYSTFFTTS
jgi:hypothetical protein